jgi:RNA-directed DNA polymerase
MSFENQVLDLELDPALLGGEPSFRVFTIQDKNPLSGQVKKRRRLEAPNKPMEIIHKRLIQYLRKLSVPMPHATACSPGDSPKKNVERHRHNRFFYVLDLQGAYKAVRVQKLAGILYKADSNLKGMFWEVQGFLRRYCMSEAGGLATGAPASPDLFNLYCTKLLDEPLQEICERFGLTYTRYLDDLTFSANHTVSRRATNEICAVVRNAGFEVHDTKTHRHDLAKKTLTLNGIGLELGGRIFVPPWYVRHVRGLLYQGIQGNLFLVPKIQGAMGVFLGIIDRKNLTVTEQKVMNLYGKFCRLVGQYKRQTKKRKRQVQVN